MGIKDQPQTWTAKFHLAQGNNLTLTGLSQDGIDYVFRTMNSDAQTLRFDEPSKILIVPLASIVYIELIEV